MCIRDSYRSVLRQLLEHVDLEGLVRDDLLQPRVLTLKLTQPLRLVRLHPAVLGTPTRPRRLRDLEVPQHLDQILALVQHPVALAELPDDLLGCCLLYTSDAADDLTR